MRILHAPRNTARQPAYLVAALRRLGHHAEVWQYGSSQFGFPADRTIALEAHNPRIFWDTFREALEAFDVFHFHLGRSLLPQQWEGTPHVLDAIRTLETDGVAMTFQLLEGASHDAVRQAIVGADIVIDNVITGDYELVSIEAMASGRVAVANVQARVRDAYPDAPVYPVTPESLGERLRMLIGDLELRRSLASAGRA